MTGHVATGAVRLFVASTEKFNPVALVKEKFSLPPTRATPPNFDWMGAGMLNDELVIPVNPLEVNVMVAPVTALAPKAVRPLKVALPETAAFVAVPPSVHVPAPT